MSLARSQSRRWPLKRAASGALYAGLLLAAGHARATVVPGGSAAAAAPPPPAHPSTCVEHVPEGKVRPNLVEHFPDKMKAGYAEYLEVSLEHGKSESVLADPNYFAQVDDVKALEQTGFILPDPRGGVAVKSSKQDKGDRTLTKVQIPFVALPSDTKQKDLILPPISIQVRRPNGETMTLCTEPHPVKVESPTANTPAAMPHSNPAYRRQLEEWSSLKQAVKIGSIGLLAGALLAALAWLWFRRPKRLPPAPPPRPPWELAFEELSELKRLELIRAQRYSDFYARVSDTVRKYLGGRYGYDGLECTTREAIGALRRQGLEHGIFFAIDQFMAQADLVKFARLTPTEPECLSALQGAETIVTATLPVAEPVRPDEPMPRNEPPPGQGAPSA
jgi:hypothetical protein